MPRPPQPRPRMPILSLVVALALALLAGLAGQPQAATMAEFQDGNLAIYGDTGSANIIRRSDLPSLLRGQPRWQTIADIGALGAAEKRDWRLADFQCLPPKWSPCLLFLSEQGKAGVVLRELDTGTGRPVADGFSLPAGPTRAAWYDDTRIMIAGNLSPGAVTVAGKPRLLKLWTRGTSQFAAETILAGDDRTLDIAPRFSLSPGGLFHAAELADGNGTTQIFHFGWAQNFRRSALPGDAHLVDFFQGRAIALVGAPWLHAGRRFPAGSLVAYPMAPLMAPIARTLPELAYTPAEGARVIDAKAGRDRLFVHVASGGTEQLIMLRKGAPDWPATDIAVPGSGALRIVAASGLADIALVARGSGAAERLYLVGRGSAREVKP